MTAILGQELIGFLRSPGTGRIEGISLSFGAKIPGPIVRLGSVDMAFNYTDYFNATPQTGYEKRRDELALGEVAGRAENHHRASIPGFAGGTYRVVASVAMISFLSRRLFQMPAKLISQGRKNLVCEVSFAARGESLKQRRVENRRRHGFVNRGL